MHVCELLEVAALVASRASTLLAVGKPISAASLESYWTASRARFDRWAHGLKRFSNHTQGRRHNVASWMVTRSVLEEILAGDVLTRIWTALLTAHDRRRGIHEAEPIGRSVFVGQLEARHRALSLLLSDPVIAPEHVLPLNRLRRRTELWSDLLIGRMFDVAELTEFAANPQRCKEFGAELRAQERSGDSGFGWSVTLAAMRGAFHEGFQPLPANPQLNAAIVNSVLAACDAEPFETTGIMRSSSTARFAAVGEDAEVLIENFLALDEPGIQQPARDLRPNSPRFQRPDRFPS
jgi:hypothetical protein